MRAALKSGLALLATAGAPKGSAILVYHRVGGGTTDELDVTTAQFTEHLDLLGASGCDVVSLDEALDRLDANDDRPSVVLTFDDGWGDVHRNAWPLLRERGVPFTIYLAAGFAGAPMRWEGSRSGATSGLGLTWEQLGELHGSGQCTIGNHTWSHSMPSETTVAEIDRCSDEIESRLGVRPTHFAYTWGVEVPGLRDALADRFRSVATTAVGRNHPDFDPLALHRIPVRRSDPARFVRAKFAGSLVPERLYGSAVRLAKRLGARS